MFRNVFYVRVQTNIKFLCMIGSDGQSFLPIRLALAVLRILEMRDIH